MIGRGKGRGGGYLDFGFTTINLKPDLKQDTLAIAYEIRLKIRFHSGGNPAENTPESHKQPNQLGFINNVERS